MTGRPWYATREQVKAALDLAETTRSNQQIDRALAGACEDIDSMCRRTFWPKDITRTFDWPNPASPTPWRYWLDEHDLVTVTKVVTGGRTLDPGSYILRPDWGPPFTYLELLLSEGAAFGGGSTWQRTIAVTGTWGVSDDHTPAGALAADTTTSATTLTVTDAGSIGVGDLLKVGTERVIVTSRRMADTGTTLTAALPASMAAQAVSVTGGDQVHEGETLLVGAERLLVDEIAGNTVVVRRAWDGSTLAAHDPGTAVWASRALTVERAACGSTGAAHTAGDPVGRYVAPQLVSTLAVAQTLVTLLQERAGYVGGKSSEGEALSNYGASIPDLRKRLYSAYARKARPRAV